MSEESDPRTPGDGDPDYSQTLPQNVDWSSFTPPPEQPSAPEPDSQPPQQTQLDWWRQPSPHVSTQNTYPAWPQPSFQPATLTYSPPQANWGPPRPKRKRRLGWIIALSIIVVIALIASLSVFLQSLGWEHTEYGYDIVERATVDANDPWVVSLPLVSPNSGSVQIYSDPTLTNPVPFVKSSDSLGITGRKRTFTPTTTTVEPSDNLPASSATFPLGAASGWPAGDYYIAETQNLIGRTLQRPRVHVYTVVGSFAPPAFTMDVVGGVPHFAWTSTQGAASYYILKSTPPSPTMSGTMPTLETIGWASSDATSWLATAQDMAYENLRQNQSEVTSYNANFQGSDGQSSENSCTPQDDGYQGMTPPDWDNSLFTFPSYAVVAVDDNGDSSLPEFQSGRDIIVDTPVATASKTVDQMNLDAGSSLYIPDSFPVTMGDCRTVFFPVAPQSLVSNADYSSMTLTYTVTGTMITHSVTGDKGSYSTVENLGHDAGLSTIVQYGPMQDLNYMTSEQVAMIARGQTPSADTPDTPYTWNGTSEMVTFIAANMYAGTTAIDLSRFTADPASPLIVDAANEAYLQNPYITDFSPIIGIRDDVLYISYSMKPDERAAAADRIKTKVDQVLSSIVDDSMTERNKALAINKYLAQNAVYDNDAADFNNGQHTRDEYVAAFPNSWDAEGVLIDGKGVCSSYAAAFKALADAAGLDSVTVTGWADTSGIGHEWVKVSIDGAWWVVDPTWNSNIWEQVHGNVQAFFMLTDAQASRTQFNGFVVDSHIPDYDTR